MDLPTLIYVPKIYIRLAETIALRELSDPAKDILTPLFPIRPWSTAKHLSKSIERIEQCFPQRKFFIDVDDDYIITNRERGSVKEYLSLIDPNEGIYEWLKFASNIDNAMPCIRFSRNIELLNLQVSHFTKIEKPFIFILNKSSGQDYSDYLSVAMSVEHSNYAICLDVGWGRDILDSMAWAIANIREILAKRPQLPIVVMGSSFPDGFVEYLPGDSVRMLERQVFSDLRGRFNEARLVYGDWGSSRKPVENEIRIAPPRIDLPGSNAWNIYRFAKDEGGYGEAAKTAMADPAWKGIGDWGGYKIQATAEGAGPNSINSPSIAAAVRINLHLARQIEANANVELLDLEEEFVD